MPTIFLSYRRDDSKTFTERLYYSLSKQLHDFDIFYDKEGIDHGADIPDRLTNELQNANLVFVVIGEKWSEILQKRERSEDKDWVKEEIKISLEDGNKTVIPLLLHGASKPTKKELPLAIEQLYDKKEYTFLDSIHWETNIKHLVDIIRKWSFKRPDEYLSNQCKKWYLEDALFTEIPVPNIHDDDLYNITMEHYFITPSYINLNELEKRNSLQKQESTSSASKLKRRKYQLQNFIPHDIISSKLLGGNNNALVIGNPGTGKSTFARWLCHTWAKKESSVQTIPFYIFLRNLDFSNADLLYYSLSSVFQTISVETLKSILINATKTILWILDGYDELSTTNQLILYKAIQKLRPNNYYILLSRPYGLLYNPGFIFAQRIQLDGFSYSQIDTYITEYLSSFGQVEKKEELIHILLENQVLSDYAHNPMMLSFIVGIFLIEKNPRAILSKIDSNYKLQAKVYEWINRRELKKASPEKLPEKLQLTKHHEKLAYEMEMSLEFIKYGYSFEGWYLIARSINNLGLARMSTAATGEVVFSFNSVTFQEFLSALFLSSRIKPLALDYLCAFPVFWNLLKMIIGQQSSDNRIQFVDSVLVGMQDKYHKTSKVKYLYLLFMFLAECPPDTVNAIAQPPFLDQFYALFKINGASSDKWKTLLLEAIRKVYYKLHIGAKRHFKQLLFSDLEPGLIPPPPDKENDPYIIPDGVKLLILQMDLYDDDAFMADIFQRLYYALKFDNPSTIYSYEVVIFVLEDLGYKSQSKLLRKHQKVLFDIFAILPKDYTSGTRIVKRMSLDGPLYSLDENQFQAILNRASSSKMDDMEVEKISGEILKVASKFYIHGYRIENSKKEEKGNILKFFSVVTSLMSRYDLEDYDIEEIFQICSESVSHINENDIYNAVFKMAIAANVSYSGVVFTDSRLLFEWYTIQLNAAIETRQTDDFLLLTYALTLCDSIQARFATVRDKYACLCQLYVDSNKDVFAASTEKHSDVYFHYSNEVNDIYKPFDKLIYFGREDNLWGEADKLSLLNFALQKPIRALAYFRDKFIPGIMGTEFNLYKKEHWATVFDYMSSFQMASLFSILRNKQLYTFESNLPHLEVIANFISKNISHDHFFEKSYLIVEFCSRTLALVYKMKDASNHNTEALVGLLESLLLHPAIKADFQMGETIVSSEGIDVLGYITCHVLTQNKQLNLISDYALLFAKNHYERSDFINGILDVFSDSQGLKLDVIASIYPLVGKDISEQLDFLIHNSGYRERFDFGVFEGLLR